MTELFQFIGALLAAFGLASLGWLALGALLRPRGGWARMVVPARGDGDGLEQAVRWALWLRRTGLWRGRVVIEDLGLTEEGLALARLLAGEGGVSFTGDCPDRI